MKEKVDIYFEFIGVEQPAYFDIDIATNGICNVIKKEGGTPGYISYIFVDDAYLLQLNRDYLKHDEYTDIITFNYNEELGNISADIYISLTRVEENALLYGGTVKEECYRVMIHGILHLFGYNDHSDMEKKNMRIREEQYLALFR